MTSPPRGLSRQVRADWRALGRHDATRGTVTPDLTAGLPEPVRRWLQHALPPGTPLRTSVELRTSGRIRLGGWRPFTAVQRIGATDGFVWAATARVDGLPVVGFDRYTHGTGQLRWRLLGVLPVLTAGGADVTRSAAGRHAGELLLAAPAAALREEVTWRAMDADRATAHVLLGTWAHDVTLTVARDGALTELVMRRWGNPAGEPFAEQVFGASLRGEVTVDGVTVPHAVAAGWHHGTERWPEGEFIRYTVDDLRFLPSA